MDKSEEKKKNYESPYTKKTQVELEEGVCATGSIDATAQSPGAETSAQQVNTGFGTDNDFTNDTWDPK